MLYIHTIKMNPSDGRENVTFSAVCGQQCAKVSLDMKTLMKKYLSNFFSISDLNSSHWYTFQPLEGATLQSMLTRILAVREVHQEHEAAQHQSPATADNDSLQ